MLALKLLLDVLGALMLAIAVAIPAYALYCRIRTMRRTAADPEAHVERKSIDWRRATLFALGGCVPLLLAAGIVVVPSGMGGVRIS